MGRKKIVDNNLKRTTVWIDQRLWKEVSKYLPTRSKSEQIRQLLSEWLDSVRVKKK